MNSNLTLLGCVLHTSKTPSHLNPPLNYTDNGLCTTIYREETPKENVEGIQTNYMTLL